MGLQDGVILAIPNGGVPVACVLAEELGLDLRLILVRKLQIPYRPEAGFGAVAFDGSILLNHGLIGALGLTEPDISKQKEKALSSLASRRRKFGPWAELPSLRGRSVILVDDGLASGFTMEAAVKSVRVQGGQRVVVAVPTASMTAYRRLETQVERVLCPDLSRLRIFAVANAYENWYDLDDAEVIHLLEGLRGSREED
jgi:predicted phosphoribosyltransferase